MISEATVDRIMSWSLLSAQDPDQHQPTHPVNHQLTNRIKLSDRIQIIVFS